jgi:hypothetical protein
MKPHHQQNGDTAQAVQGGQSVTGHRSYASLIDG